MNCVTLDRTHAYRVEGASVGAGGKWTTYRRMAQDAVDLACLNGRMPQGLACQTSHLPLLGAHAYDPALFTEVAQNYTVPHRPGAIDTRVAKHLAGQLCLPAKQARSCHTGPSVSHTTPVLPESAHGHNWAAAQRACFHDMVSAIRKHWYWSLPAEIAHVNTLLSQLHNKVVSVRCSIIWRPSRGHYSHSRAAQAGAAPGAGPPCAGGGGGVCRAP